MSQQRRIDLLFTTTVMVMRLGRLTRSAGPALAMLLVVIVAVHGTLGGEAGLQAAMAAHRASLDLNASSQSERSATGAGNLLTGVAGRALGDRPVPSVAEAAPTESQSPVAATVRLDREQSNIARFIASRYRTTLETTNQFVFHAYQAARDAKIDPMLVLAVMSVESSFDPRAQSSAGAQGLMQVLTKVHAEKFLPFGGIPAAFDPVANIRVGSDILKQYLKREGTVEGALKSYVGAAFLQDDGGYGQKVLNARERIAAAAAGKPVPPELVMSAKASRSDAVAVDSSTSAPANLQVEVKITEGPSAQRTEPDIRDANRDTNREASLVAPAAESGQSGQHRSAGGVTAPHGSGDI
jgi:soluble lytic murein transglycosylase-like protein